VKVLQINQSDLVGSRFQNLAIRDLLGERGIDSKHLVWNKKSDLPSVRQMFDRPWIRSLNRRIGEFEKWQSTHSMYQFQSMFLPSDPWFQEADVIHYHIVHDGFFSLQALPFLARLKPSVWTWHDPWIMTGHCIYPLGCDRWKSGCGSCPDLGLPFPMKRDKTSKAFQQKQRIVEKSELEVVLASSHMFNMAEASPIGRGARKHQIPFGIDLDVFKPVDPQPARQRLGVLEGRIVIAVRAFHSPYKGFEYFLEALRSLSTKVPLTILSTHEKGTLNEFIGKHQLIELGWVDDEELVLATYQAADFFVMPSTAEAFGMMAIEAMASGKPVIVFEGTSLPEVTHAPDVGIAVPMRDSKALCEAMTLLIENSVERRRRGDEGRKIAERFYGAVSFADRMAQLYRDTFNRHPKTKKGRLSL
jgi:glycosyltransferase involved in cell wall biosynthesis